MDHAHLAESYLRELKIEVDGLIEDARMARLLGDHALARTRSDRLYELQFDHIQLMRAYALTLERETRKDPLNREELLRLKRIIEHNASSSSQHLNALAIAQVLEYGEDEGTSQW